MARRLGLGQYCGSSVRRRQIHGFVITENRFGPGVQIDRHFHDHAHFTFILEGEFSETYDRMVLECLPGSTLFVPANVPHTDRIGPEGAHTIGVEVSPGVADRVMNQTGVLRDACVLADPSLMQTGHRLYREFRSSDPAALLSMESAALEMMVLSASARAGGEKGEPAWMDEARRIIHAGFTQPISLADIAQRVQVHETHLARAFRRRHGCTVGEYIRRLRVNAAAADLARNKRSIAEIGAACGFYDQSHFCRTFKRAYGVSPSDYRSALASYK